MNNIISQEEKDKIDAICVEYGIFSYSINPNGSIDVDGGVFLQNNQLRHVPLKFGKVSGDFDCSGNVINTLLGCPNEVGGSFDCSDNKLSSLEHCPKVVGGSFYYNFNNYPEPLFDAFGIISGRKFKIFLLYQSYYDVWTPEFNEENMKYLIAEIKDGLE
jgi:hypothetical protein